MSDEKVDRLGTYFVAMDINSKYGITFERFTQLVEAGTWGDYVA